MHLSQPAVSQQVRSLEEEAGARLFDRGNSDGHGSQIALTEAERVLLEYATTAAETMAEAQRALAALHDDVAGELRLGASTTIAQYVLPRILGGYVPHYLPQTVGIFAALNRLGRSALTVVLFLIGTGITRNTLKEVGTRPLIQGITLWLVVASISLWAIHAGWIAL